MPPVPAPCTFVIYRAARAAPGGLPPVGATVHPAADIELPGVDVIVPKSTAGTVVEWPLAKDGEVGVEWPILGGTVFTRTVDQLAPVYVVPAADGGDRLG